MVSFIMKHFSQSGETPPSPTSLASPQCGVVMCSSLPPAPEGVCFYSLDVEHESPWHQCFLLPCVYLMACHFTLHVCLVWLNLYSPHRRLACWWRRMYRIWKPGGLAVLHRVAAICVCFSLLHPHFDTHTHTLSHSHAQNHKILLGPSSQISICLHFRDADVSEWDTCGKSPWLGSLCCTDGNEFGILGWKKKRKKPPFFKISAC